MAQIVFNSAFKEKYSKKNNKINIDNFINYLVEAENPSKYILVLPTKRYVDSAKDKLILERSKKKKLVTPRLNFYTFEDFSKIVLDTIIKNKPNDKKKNIVYIDNATVMLAMQEAVNRVNKKKEFEYYNQEDKENKKTKNNISPSVLERISNIITGLKKDGFTSTNIDDEKANKSLYSYKKYDKEYDTGNKYVEYIEKRFRDICRIYKEYEKILGDVYLDQHSINYRIVKEFNEAEISENQLISLDNIKNIKNIDNIDEIECILFYGFCDLTIPQVNFLSIFTDSKIPICINLTYPNPSKINTIDDTVKRMTNVWYEYLNIDNKTKFFNQKIENAVIDYITNNLFEVKDRAKDEKIVNSLNEKIEVYSAKNVKHEVQSIINLIYYLKDQKNVKLNDICVCSPVPNKYSAIIREEFSESNLLINLFDRFSLSKSYIYDFVYRYLEIYLKGINFNNLKELSRDYFLNEKILQNIKEKEISLDDIYNPIDFLLSIISKYRILIPNQRLKRSIDNLEKELNYLIENVVKHQTEKNKIYDAVKIIGAIKDIFKIEEYAKTYYSIKEFRELVIFIIDEISNWSTLLPELDKKLSGNSISIRQFQLKEELEKSSRAVEVLKNILDTLVARYDDFSGNEKKQYDLVNLIEIFNVIVSNSKYTISEKQGDIVRITSLDQIQGSSFKYIILCGMIEGDFPKVFTMDKFLGRELPHSKDIHNHKERMELYKFLIGKINRVEKIYFFYPKASDFGGNARSSFIESILDMCSMKKEDAIRKEKVVENQEWNLYNVFYSDIMYNKYKSDNNIDEEDVIKELRENIKEYKRNISDDIEKNYCLGDDCSEDLKNRIYEELILINQKEKEQKEHIYSTSELEEYAECGLKYFIGKILNASEAVDELKESYSGLEKGNIIHEILKEFYKNEIKNSETEINGFKTFDLNNYTEEEIQSKLKKKAEEVLDGYKYNNPVIQFERSKIINILDNWVKYEFKKLKEWQYHTVFVETKFDNVNIELNTNTIDSDNEKSDSIKLKGRVDRIELNDENKILIADYKTGSTEKYLQLPFYIHPEVIKAIKENLGIKLVDVEESDSYCYSLKYPIKNYLNPNKTKTNDIIPMVKVIKDNIDKLIFHQKKINDKAECCKVDSYNICNKCDYKSFCGTLE